MADRVHTVVDSPIGPLTLVWADGALVGLSMDVTEGGPRPEVLGRPDRGPFSAVTRQLAEYFAGERTEFDLPLRPAGTDFQRTVWKALIEIPYGETISYGEVAVRIGRPGASRAVGLANGRNPIAVIVPCHRVIGSTGVLTGYGGGLERKRLLLDLERRAREPMLPGFG